MRLLTSKTLTLQEFPTVNTPYIPDYAILSHTWGEQEVSFQDMQNPSSTLHQTLGYKKIENCGKQALSEGFDYFWVDTCCIDKTNNVEFTEAVNSMFQWYRNAQVCYAYLTDVIGDEDPRTQNSKFRNCRWFTRKLLKFSQC